MDIFDALKLLQDMKNDFKALLSKLPNKRDLEALRKDFGRFSKALETLTKRENMQTLSKLANELERFNNNMDKLEEMLQQLKGD